MNLVLEQLQNNVDSEEDDYGSYFLQPASSPYNIAERVQQANIDLFSNFPVAMEKTSKVKFKEELISYEPDAPTDEDINSLESDFEEDYDLPAPQPESVSKLEIFDIPEDEEITEELDSEQSKSTVINETFCSLITGYQDSEKSTKSVSSERDNPAPVKAARTGRRTPKREVLIECKNHCIERLDFDLSMSIKRLEIREKPVPCPLLKLQQRKCCDENRVRNPTSLPCYNGHRSEYGLSSEELKRREKRLEMIRLKEEKREVLMKEYRQRRNEQNEEVFSQWLRGVVRRKAQRRAINGGKTKQCFSPNVVSFPTKVYEKVERPKTANEFVPKQSAKKAKRPHTSAACVFIEVPRKILEHGIHIGDLLVTNNNFPAKKMHILTLSS